MKSLRAAPVVAAVLALSATTAFAEDAVGKWTGTVKASEGLIPVSVTFTKAPNGALTGVSQSSKKGGGAPLKVEKIVTDGKTLSFAVPAADGDFKGEWQAEKKSWVGRWAAQDGPLDMVLTRAK